MDFSLQGPFQFPLQSLLNIYEDSQKNLSTFDFRSTVKIHVLGKMSMSKPCRPKVQSGQSLHCFAILSAYFVCQNDIVQISGKLLPSFGCPNFSEFYAICKKLRDKT